MGKNLEFSVEARNKFSKTFTALRLAMKANTSATAQLRINLSKLSTAVTVLGTKMAKTSAQTRGAKTQMRGFGASVKSTIPAIKSFVKFLRLGFLVIGVTSLITAFSSLRRVLTGLLKTGAQFQQNMSVVRGILRSTIPETLSLTTVMAGLTTVAVRLGRSSLFSAREVAGAMAVMARAGLEVKEILEAIDPAVRLAEAGQLALADATRITTQIMRGMEKSAAELVNIMDVLAATAAKSNQTVQDIGNAMSFAASAVRLAGAEFTDVSAALGILANAGIRGTIAGTALRKIFSTIFRDMERGNTAIGKVSDQLFSIQDGRLKFVGFAKAVELLRKEGLDATSSFAVFGVRAGNAFAVLSNAGGDAIAEFRAKLEDVANFSNQLAADIKDNLVGDVTILKSAWEGLGIAITQSGTEPMRLFVQGLTELVNKAANSTEFFTAMQVGIKFAVLSLATFGRMILRVVKFGITMAKFFADVILFPRDLGDKALVQLRDFFIKAQEVFAKITQAFVHLVVIPIITLIEQGITGALLAVAGTFGSIGIILGATLASSDVFEGLRASALATADNIVSDFGLGADAIADIFDKKIKSGGFFADNEMALNVEQFRDVIDSLGSELSKVDKILLSLSLKLALTSAEMGTISEKSAAFAKLQADLKKTEQVAKELQLGVLQIKTQGTDKLSAAMKSFGFIMTTEFEHVSLVLNEAVAQADAFGFKTEALVALAPQLRSLRTAFEKTLGAPLETFLEKGAKEGFGVKGLLEQLDQSVIDDLKKLLGEGIELDSVKILIDLLVEAKGAVALLKSGLTDIGQIDLSLTLSGLKPIFAADQEEALFKAKQAIEALGGITIKQKKAETPLQLNQFFDAADRVKAKIVELRDTLSSESRAAFNEFAANAAAVQGFSLDFLDESIIAVAKDRFNIDTGSLKEDLAVMALTFREISSSSLGTNAEMEILISNLERVAILQLEKIAPGFAALARGGLVDVQAATLLAAEKMDEFKLSVQEALEEFGKFAPTAIGIQESLLIATEGWKKLQNEIVSGNLKLTLAFKEMKQSIKKNLIAGIDQFANAIVNALEGGKNAFKDFAKSFIKGMAVIIIKALILAALFRAFPALEGAFVIAGKVAGASKGGVVQGNVSNPGLRRKKGGLIGRVGMRAGGFLDPAQLVGGVDLGRDSVPALLQPGEAVLPQNLTSLLVDAAKSRKGLRGAAASGGGADPVVITLNVKIETPDKSGVRDFFIDNNDELMDAIADGVRQRINGVI